MSGKAPGVSVVLMMVLSLGAVHNAHAQRFTVVGSVTDSAGIALEGANVIVLARADSALIQFGTTRSDGTFTIGRLQGGSFVLQVSYVGLQTALRAFDVEGADLDVGRIVLQSQTEVLEEFVITADRLPYVIRGDTIEYNPLAFLVRPQDMVEDLLRRLPGIDVDRYGTIMAQGKAVEHVLVEGKKFFSSDYTIATRNLPADAVDKVQVYDKPSAQAELTGVPDGRDEKTVNLKLTEEAKRGAFGQTTGGFGGTPWDQVRYFGRASLFRFSPKTQLALIGNAENVNQPGFSMTQLRSFRGAGSVMFPEDGIAESLGAGFNFNRDFGGKTNINASYFLTDRTNTQESTLQRKALLGTTVSAFSHDASRRKAGHLSHALVVQTDVEFGEGNTLRFEGTLTKALSSVGRTGQESTTNPIGLLLTDALMSHDQDGDNLSGQARLDWSKRISQSGRSVVITSSVNVSDAAEAIRLDSETRLYNAGDLHTRDELHQLQEAQSSSFTHRQRLQLLQPLATGRTLSLHVERSATNRKNDKGFFDFGEGGTMRYSLFSEEYGQHYEYWRSGTDFSFQNADRSWYLWSKLGIQHSFRRGTVKGLDRAIRSRYTTVLPFLIVQRELGGSSDLMFTYDSITREPTLLQLQPFTDNRNPLRIYYGNPALTPEYLHQWGLKYSLYQSYPGNSLIAYIGAHYTHNSIVYERTVDAQLRQTLRPVNSGGVWSVDGNASFGRPLRSLGLEWDVRYYVDMERGTELINGRENTTVVLRHRPLVELSYYWGDVIHISTTGRISWNQVRYSLNEELNQRYVNGSVDVDAYWNPSDQWSFEASFLYRAFDRDLFGAGQDITLLNLGLSRLFLEGRGNLELEVHDVLNKSQGVTVTSAATYIQEERIASLGRYVMLKFTYKPRLM